MKKATQFIILATLCSALALAGCSAGGNGAPLSVAAPGDGVTAVPGTGNGTSTPGASVVALAWDAPSTNTNGTALQDLAGYKVHYGTAPGSYTGSVDVGTVTSCSISGLGAGTYYLVVTAYNKAGAESTYSNEVSKAVSL